MKISDLISNDSIILDFKASSKQQVLENISKFVADKSDLNHEKILKVLQDRENICSTAIDEGVAIPHGKLSGLNNIICVLAISNEGIDFDSLDDKPSHIFISILSPDNSSNLHIQALSTISKVFKNSELRKKILQSGTINEIYNLIIENNGS
ncbi:MAG: PTS sugar transporter subunit IIA [Thermodesulfobacteriota bacterium]